MNVIDRLASRHHDAWMAWSKELATHEHNLSRERVERWKKLWVPYFKLSEHYKDIDREWAEKTQQNLGTPCPVWQCGGEMQRIERKPPEHDDDEWVGDFQTPDLKCTNCKALYQFQGFKKRAGGKK